MIHNLLVSNIPISDLMKINRFSLLFSVKQTEQLTIISYFNRMSENIYGNFTIIKEKYE